MEKNIWVSSQDARNTLNNCVLQVNVLDLLDFLSQLGRPDHLDGFLCRLCCLRNIAPEIICQLLQLWLGLISIEEVGLATCWWSISELFNCIVSTLCEFIQPETFLPVNTASASTTRAFMMFSFSLQVKYIFHQHFWFSLGIHDHWKCSNLTWLKSKAVFLPVSVSFNWCCPVWRTSVKVAVSHLFLYCMGRWLLLWKLKVQWVVPCCHYSTS